jgi:hypothetical protein
LGFDGPTKKACPVLGLSKPMGLPIAKRGNCDRESSGSQILMPGSELDESGSLISPFEDMLGYNHKNDEGLGEIGRKGGSVTSTASSYSFIYTIFVLGASHMGL